jgi:hypothetical protein
MMFGIGQDPFQGQVPPGMEAGPLGDIQNQVASVLNGDGMGNRIYIPGGPDEPVFQVPNPARWGFPGAYRSAPAPVSPQPPGGRSTSSRGWGAVVFLIVLVVLLTVAVIVLAVGR